jgi:uncharacterized protein (TIGR02001 family)
VARADPVNALVITGQAMVVSDFRYRGITLSDGKPALQASLTVLGADGLYGGVWASSIADYGGAHTEVDFIAGDRQQFGPATVDLSVVRYSYPTADHLSYWEIPVTLTQTVSTWTLTEGAAYAPAQRGTVWRSNAYGFAGVDWREPASPLGLSASLGYEDGAFAEHKVDWNLGGRLMLGKGTLSLSYVGFTSNAAHGGALVASAGIAF